MTKIDITKLLTDAVCLADGRTFTGAVMSFVELFPMHHETRTLKTSPGKKTKQAIFF